MSKHNIRLRLGQPSLLVLVLATNAAEPFGAAARADSPNADAEITVIATPRPSVIDPTLAGPDLQRQLRPTLGDTLAHLPGVSASSFGPGVSRPVLRGFQGDRVPILTDGIGSFDISNSSADHAVTIAPLTAERVEVVRGAATLLYSSAAIGGIVNVTDSRIPRHLPDGPVAATFAGTLGSAANERALAAAIDVRASTQLVLHLDASRDSSDDLRTGGHILTRQLREAAPDLAGLAGVLPNSASRSWQLAGSAALIGEKAMLGFAVTRYDNLYGIPIRYRTEASGEAEQVRLDARQWREDLRGEIATDGALFSHVRLRAGHARYRHVERTDDGAIGSRFAAESHEARLELEQTQRGGWNGITGTQIMGRTLAIAGDEKFLPKNRTRQWGLFTLQKIDLGAVHAEIGGRYQRSILSADADAEMGVAAVRRRFDSLSASAAGSVALAPGWRAGLTVSRNARAPAAEELFANGPHAGTQAFELGNSDLGVERAWGMEASLHGQGNGYSLSAAFFYNRFSTYIYETQSAQTTCEAAAHGRSVDLPCFVLQQGPTRHRGFEVEGSLRLATLGDYAIIADALADHVRVDIVGDGPAPRIPPLRLLGGLEAQSERLKGRLEIEWVSAQRRVTGFETPTPGYRIVNASLSFTPTGLGGQASITLSADNIFDSVARRHASFLKDYAPRAGRDIRAGIRLAF